MQTVSEYEATLKQWRAMTPSAEREKLKASLLEAAARLFPRKVDPSQATLAGARAARARARGGR